MTQPQDSIREHLRELERSFAAFEKGDRNRLFESRDSLTALSEAVDRTGSDILGPICEVASRLLGVVLMEGQLTEGRAVQVVRELLSFVEAQVLQMQTAEGHGSVGGVFHVVNSEKVGDMLVRKGLIAPEQLEKALLLQRVSKGKRVGQVLVAMNAIDQRTLDSILDSQKAETRRAETRRTAPGGAPSSTNSPLPPLPTQQPPTELRLAPPPAPDHPGNG